MSAALSAVEAVMPAFEQAKRQLFQPFRFGRWARLAVVSLLTGEFAGGSWGGGNVNLPSQGGGGSEPPPEELLLLAETGWERVLEFLPWIVAGVLGAIALGLLWLYAASVFRFILLDAVLTDRCELGTGWRRWQGHGGSYFLWQIGFTLATLVVLAVLVGLPIFLAWRAGVFRQPDQHFGLLLGGGVILFIVLVGLFFLSALVAVFAKDFVVPVMALENRGVLDAWRRVLPILAAEKLASVGYVLMKIVLAVGSAILFGILNLIVILVLLIPVGIAGVALFMAAKAAGLTWTPLTIAAAIALGSLALLALLWVISFVSTPALVFFQSYALYFLGGRYPVLGALLWRSAPPSATSPSPARP